MKTVAGVVLLGALVAGMFLLNRAARTEDGKSVLHVADAPEVAVEVSGPELRDIIRTVQAPGAVEALLEVDISAEVVGKIVEMPVEEGDRVRKGDLLCRLDDADHRARLTQAEANVAKLKATIVQADADLDKAQRDFTRQKALSEADATSAVELADYHTTFLRARALVEIRRQELVEAEARLQSAREDLDKTVITSPIDGVVSQRFAKAGEVVVMGTMNNAGTRIMVISDLSKMQVRCRVDESDAALVRPDQPSRIFLQSNSQESVPGHVVRVATKGTKPQGRDVVTFETLLLVDSDDPRVRPGMTANVEIEVDRRNEALTIPVQAVVHRKRRDLTAELQKEVDALQAHLPLSERLRAGEYVKLVFCAVAGAAQARLVETGISDAKSVEVVRGVEPVDQVVVGPYRSLDALQAGAKVKLEGPKEPAKQELAGPPADAAPKEEEAVAQSQ
ncbi:MAG: efflux RND transporter periplasmic adaptor subunit [Planctomycetes bacterium]|nr:efflux RND transporter periplasmic adaptor subunit [Planctomycetota bacterium]